VTEWEDNARAIGFNEDVRYGGRVFHVQTEVQGDAMLRICTIVTESGAVWKKETTGCPMDLDSLLELEKLVYGQHKRWVERVGGGVEWLEST
jgi:hypothetical protein